MDLDDLSAIVPGEELFRGGRVTITIVPHGYEFDFEVTVGEEKETDVEAASGDVSGQAYRTFTFGMTRDFSGDDGHRLFRHLVDLAEQRYKGYLEGVANGSATQ